MSLERSVKELLERGDVGKASEEVIRGLGPRVLRYLRSVLRDEDQAADAFSLFAESVWQGLAKFRGDSALLTWALWIARNVALDLRRNPWNRDRQRLSTGAASALADSIRTRTHARWAQREEDLAVLRKGLSTEEQSLLVLRMDQRLSWAQIADVLSRDGTVVQPATVMKRFERLKARLGKMARRRGLLP
ncbi:MAG TPA: sigma-70 family RNA polymerase sigma factor [Anaeromyxobacteraceae bacterium]|nr:sigma-70 family RNA polymerase sigma factor [Anaeromyxobacteraceae bacterium]